MARRHAYEEEEEDYEKEDVETCVP